MVRRNSGITVVVLVAALSVRETSSAAAAAENSSAAALTRFASLAGEWEGPVQWTGGRTDRGTMKARYFTTGYGSAVVETLISDGVPSMTTVYHADGPDLRMTHYCGARNQPRLKSSKIDLAAGTVEFVFVDATNLSSPDAPHVTGLSVLFGDADHVTLTFTFQASGKPAFERISLQRVPPSGR